MAAEFFSFLGSGDVLIDVLTDAGVPRGFQIKGNATSFAIKTDSERKEQMGRGLNNFGQVIASVVIPKPTTLEIKLDQVDAELLALACSGEVQEINQAAGSATAQVVVAKKGRWVELGNGKINLTDTGLVVTNSGATTTYVKGTDFEINYRLGMICALDAGTITDGQELKVDYSWAATTGKRIRGGTKSSIRASIKLDGKNEENGKKVFVDVPLTRLNTSGTVDLLNGNWVEVPLSGVVEMRPGQEQPFTMDILDED